MKGSAVTNAIAGDKAEPELARILAALGGVPSASEAAACRILLMVRAGGPATIVANAFWPEDKISIVCHPDTYRQVRRLLDEFGDGP